MAAIVSFIQTTFQATQKNAHFLDGLQVAFLFGDGDSSFINSHRLVDLAIFG